VYNRINLLNDFFDDLQRWFCKLVGHFHILRPQPGFWKNKTSATNLQPAHQNVKRPANKSKNVKILSPSPLISLLPSYGERAQRAKELIRKAGCRLLAIINDLCVSGMV
jgi:hypothetical protein